MALCVQLNQFQLCTEFGVEIRNELATKYAALKIKFPEESFHALDAINISSLTAKYTIKNFINLHEEDLANLSKVGITRDKIKQVACLANYYAEHHYLGNKKTSQDLELIALSNEGIQFTVLASVEDDDQAKNLAFSHPWQRESAN